jgi:hypothetical protein
VRINSEGIGGRKTVIIETEESQACSLGYSFVVSSKVITLSNTNPHLYLWFKNTSATKTMCIWVVWFGWNGGSANQNKVVKWGWVIAPNEPTANHTAVTPGNLNFTSSTPAEALVYKWDGVGDGMTYTGGVIPTEGLFTRGYNPLDARGIPILGENDAFGMLFTGEEIGDAVVTIRFYYK